MTKTKVFHFGACDLMDALNRHSILREYDILTQGTIYPFHGTSLLSLYTKPGSVAEQMHDFMYKYMRSSYQTNPVYLEVTKFPYFDYWKKNAGPNDIMVLNFSTEMYTKFFTANEKFSILPQFRELEHLHWVRDSVLFNNNAHLYFDDETNLGMTKELLVDFANHVKEVFQDRVILCSTNLTEKVFVNPLLPVTGEALDIYAIPYYHGVKFSMDHRNREFAQSLVDRVMRGFQRLYGFNVPLVTLEEEFRFIDANHKWGRSPLHLHSSSIDILSAKLHAELDRIRNRRIVVDSNIVI